MNLLLLSNSTMPGQDYLSWPKDHILETIKNAENVLFIPYAGVSITWDDYTATVRNALGKSEQNLRGIHTFADSRTAFEYADAILVGGGNTFQLTERLQELRLIDAIRVAVFENDIPYVGWSAGSNVACPGIYTTNDMPITQPHSFNALHLFPVQINAHYTNQTLDGHGGESRDMRLKEFVMANPAKRVLCLEEGSGVRVANGSYSLVGEGKAFGLSSGGQKELTTTVDLTSFLTN